MQRGNTEVFHSNRVIASLKEHDINGEYFTYWFHLVENIFGKFLRIQAKQQDIAGNLVAHNGVIINFKYIDKVIDSLNKIKEHHLNSNEPNE